MAERRQLGARPHRAQHPSRPLGGRPRVGGAACDGSAGRGQFVDAVGNAVFTEIGQVRAEGVRLDAVGSDIQVGGVDVGHHIGSSDVEDLVAALMPLEILQGGVPSLEHRAHGPVRHDHSRGPRLAERPWAGGRENGRHDGPSVVPLVGPRASPCPGSYGLRLADMWELHDRLR